MPKASALGRYGAVSGLSLRITGTAMPNSKPARAPHPAFLGSVSMPSDSTTAMPFQACAAGAGNLAPCSWDPISCPEVRSRKIGTQSSTPAAMPTSWAWNCLRGHAPSR